MDQEPYARVGLKEIMTSLAELKSKVELLAIRIESVTDHESRIRQLEESRWPMKSIALIASLVSVLVGISAVIIKGKT